MLSEAQARTSLQMQTTKGGTGNKQAQVNTGFESSGSGKREAVGDDASFSWRLSAAWDQENVGNDPRGPSAPTQPEATSPATLTISALPHRPRFKASPSKALHRQNSPGALLRLQSSSTRPAPFPLPDLARLTAACHLQPMTNILHSMASLSRAGMENSRRKINQDSVFAFRKFVEPHQAIAGVFDGHGPQGHAVSSFVKSQLPNMVAKQLKQKGEAAAGAALRAAFLQTQEALRTTPAINSRLSGSTAVVVLLQGRRVTTAWVGDSRAMLVRRQSLHSACQGIQLTQDHKPSSTAELSRILACGGRVERLSDAMGREVGPQRVWLPGSWVPGLAMSRALGDFVAHSVGVTADADVTVTELSDRDEWLVVASDGVWEFISIQEAAEVVGGCGGAEEACRKLVEQAASRWEKANEGLVDDISVAIARFMPK